MQVRLAICAVAGLAICAAALPAGEVPLRPDSTGAAFDFATDEIEGTLRTDGSYHGVTRLVHKRTGRQVIDPRYSALNLFKLMSTNQMMDQPRQMERHAKAEGASVEIVWPPSEGHRGELVARYTVRTPRAVDLDVTVRSQGTYSAYELFLSSYFDKAFEPHVWLQSRRREPPQRVLPVVNDVFRGAVLVFPRDSLAARNCLDGRWERDERKTPTVQMCPVRHYAHCLAVQADPANRLGVVLMSDPRSCYAISTRYHAHDDADRLTTYSAFDLSLFGADAVPGAELHARVRLAILELDDNWDNVLAAYREFLGQ